MSGDHAVESSAVIQARASCLRLTAGDDGNDASLGMSTHFGTCVIDQEKGTITFKIDSASFPNWDGTTQVRQFTLKGDELTWKVPPRPDGSVPVSSFKRVR
jgi:hypothetical protein